MRAIALLAATAASAWARTLWHQLSPAYTYEAWLEEHGSRFPGTKAAFEDNLRTILAHNANPDETWKMGVNQFTGLTQKEYRAAIKGYKSSGVHRGGQRPDLSAHVAVSALPASLDWRTHTPSIITPPKDQAGCGSCWAFSATEAIESNIALATGKLLTLSPQEIVSCTPNPQHCGGAGGCSGATQELAFNNTVFFGITSDANYPYTSGRGVSGTCNRAKVAQPVAKIASYVYLPPNNYTSLMNAVVSAGPISISVDAAWGSYETGVFSSSCGATIDHAVVLDGYGTDPTSGLDYYLVRNSWGASWGEHGYIRIVRMGEGKEPCAVDRDPAEGDGCDGGPPTQTVCGLCGILSDSSYPVGGTVL